MPEQKHLSVVPDVEEELDKLYALPLEEFTAARNDLARRLVKAGRRDTADEVKKLPKPSVPVWTANQLARREPGEVRALLRSAEDLRKAQQRALSGKGGQELAKRVEEQRRAVRALAHLGRDILASEGRSVSDAIVERTAKTLEAAALDDGSRFLLRAGRLTEELEPPGFDALAGMAATGTSTQPSGGKTGKRERVAEARRRLQEARQELRAQARAALDAEHALKRAESAAADARREAQDARERADEAEQAVADAERALRDAQRG